jgi:hypothetical protein
LDLLILGNSFFDQVSGFIIDGEFSEDNAAASSDLSGVHHSIVLAETDPFTDLLAIRNSDKGNIILFAKSFDELLVLGFVAVISQEAEDWLLSVVDGLADFMEALSQAVSERGGLEDSLDGGVEVKFLDEFLDVFSVDHWALRSLRNKIF